MPSWSFEHWEFIGHSGLVIGHFTMVIFESSAVIERVPTLSHHQPFWSMMPRYKRVAPLGTTNCWRLPLSSRPSPMKKTCLSCGERVEKFRLASVEKSRLAAI